MISEKEYVILSLELNLYFARIMKEHSIFLEASFTPKNADFSTEADNFKLQFEMILLNTVQVCNGIVRSNVLTSGEIITDFTLETEEKTQNLTGIAINQNITKMSSRLHSGNYAAITPDLVRYVRQLNHNAKILAEGLIRFKEKVLHAVLSGSMFTSNYPLLLEHILHEARLYNDYLIAVDNGQNLDHKDIQKTELFWDQIMMEHALFIRGLLDPSENDLINTSNNFAKEYASLLESARTATDSTIKSVTNDTLEETIKFKEFEIAGTEGISKCKIKSIIIPLLADHVLRESNHFIRLLKTNMP